MWYPSTMKQPAEQPRLRSVLEAARYLGISRNTCWSLVRAGDLPHIKINRRVLIDQCDIDAFIQAHKVTAADQMTRIPRDS